jgi:hypothetical protein
MEPPEQEAELCHDLVQAVRALREDDDRGGKFGRHLDSLRKRKKRRPFRVRRSKALL